jgi:hypothetical protein
LIVGPVTAGGTCKVYPNTFGKKRNDMKTLTLQIPIDPSISPQLLRRPLSARAMLVIQVAIEHDLMYPYPVGGEDREAMRDLPVKYWLDLSTDGFEPAIN